MYKDKLERVKLRAGLQTGNNSAAGGPEGALYDLKQNAQATIAERVASKH